MITDLEARLNPRIALAPDGPVLFLERLTRHERELAGGDRIPAGKPLPGPLGGLAKEILRRARRRLHRVPLPRGALVLGRRTLVMGILNVTPDSFSDGGLWTDPDRAAARGLEMVRQGARIVDVGGESSRPGARRVPEREELRRVLPVVERLAKEGVLVSIDTAKAGVAREAFRAGAKILNDITALRGDPAMARTAARAGAAVILMHMKGTPRTMQKDPRYEDVVADICRFFRKTLNYALSGGIPRDNILLDPGIGFGKKPEHNVEILRRLDEFRSLGCPLVIGTSRKSFIGHYLNRRADERLAGTAATVAAAVLRGADIVRVHDVREMSDVARMADLLR
jgi:dihydropteroate synthase